MKKILILIFFFLASLLFADNYKEIENFYLHSNNYTYEKFEKEINRLKKDLVTYKDKKIKNNNSLYTAILEELKINDKSAQYLFKYLKNKDKKYLKLALNNDAKNIFAFLEYVLTFDEVKSINEAIVLYKNLTNNSDLVEYIFAYYLVDSLKIDKVLLINEDILKYVIKNEHINILSLNTNISASIKYMIYNKYLYGNNTENTLESFDKYINNLIKYSYLVPNNEKQKIYDNVFVNLNIQIALVAKDNKEWKNISNKLNNFTITYAKDNNLNILNNDNMKFLKQDFIKI